MVQPDFGEGQFMWDLMNELRESYPEAIMGFPFYPTQNKEKWYGADSIFVRKDDNIPISTIFLQFKRSHMLEGNRAKRRNYFGGSYYRFELHTKNQHNTLVNLNNELGVAGYVAPGFHKTKERIKYLSNGEILDNSLFIPPERKAEDDNHTICFTTNPVASKMYSTPEDIDQAQQINALIDDVLESGSEFETFDAQRVAFREQRSTLVEEFDYIPQNEYPTEGESENALEWMTDQQQFYKTYFDIYPQFFLGEGEYWDTHDSIEHIFKLIK